MTTYSLTSTFGTSKSLVLCDRTKIFRTTECEVRMRSPGRRIVELNNLSFYRVKGTHRFENQNHGDFDTYFKKKYPESYEAWQRSVYKAYLDQYKIK